MDHMMLASPVVLPAEPTALAYTDPLTGLANRALFADRMHKAMLFARQSGSVFAVLMLDLDDFGSVNDRHGHEVGDVALQLAVRRLRARIRQSDTLARIGGDEYAVVLQGLGDRRPAALVAQRLIDTLAAPLELGPGASAAFGASIGIAAWPDHADSVDTLVAAAAMAMYRAKRTGRNRFCWADRRADADNPSLAALAWRAAHAIGIATIDDQHLHLAGLINQLSSTLTERTDNNAVLSGLHAIVDYAAFHFGTEESLMEQHGVADFAQHQAEHRRLLHDIGNLRIDGELTNIGLILRYLQEWLLRHVDGMDRRLGQTLIELGCC
jgi:diguanylate cyclase (GGDEF)-like protein/hemerythrin-like metal-binding protein